MRKQKVKLIYSIIAILLNTLILFMAYTWFSFYTKPLIAKTEESRIFKLQKGSNAQQLSQNLQAGGYIKHPGLFLLLLRLTGKTHHLQAGEYLITAEVTPVKLANSISTGKVLHYAITFVEGWTIKQLENQLKKQTKLKITDNIFEKFSQHYKLSNKLEGMFFPATYYYAADDSVLELLKKTYDLMQKILYNEWENRAVNVS